MRTKMILAVTTLLCLLIAAPSALAAKPQCNDRIDNDGDRLIDYPSDPGCTSKSDDSEINSSPPPTMFADEFSGAAGAAPDPAKWYVIANGALGGGYTTSPANVFHDGQGNLVVRTSRNGSAFTGAFIGTFNYGADCVPCWPPTQVKATFPVPYRMEMRALQPSTPGAWTALWPMSTDSASPYELDVAEERLTFPTVAESHQHHWVNGSDVNPWNSSPLSVSNMTTNWHVYSADVTTTGVTYKVDGVTVGTAYGVTGSQGILLYALIGNPGSWESGGAQPAPGDPGPWDMLVDYVRVTAL